VKLLITALIIGVDGLERLPTFYRDGLCLQTNGVMGTEFKCDETRSSFMFELQIGVIIVLIHV
jgi:hypothetical protein